MPEELIKACVDRVRERKRPPENVSHLVLLTSKKWPNHKVLRVHFLDGDPVVQDKVEAVAYEWCRYCNIRFKFDNDPQAEIRISFEQEGSWSYIGTDARWIPTTEPTMNFGWLTPNSADSEYERVVIHEFGHALGMVHEHQNPRGEIPWNKPAVYEYYGGPPNNWTKEQVDTNLFKTYAKDQVNATEFDPESIMLYPVPNKFTVGDFEVGWNRMMSEQDKRYVSELYPKPANELLIGDPPRAAAIDAVREIDTYVVNVYQRGTYRFETSGRTDLVMSLYGPEDDAIYIDQDDDSGRRLNPKIVANLDWGQYTVRVQHFSKKRTGAYDIQVTAEE